MSFRNKSDVEEFSTDESAKTLRTAAPMATGDALSNDQSSVIVSKYLTDGCGVLCIVKRMNDGWDSCDCLDQDAT